MSKGFIPDFAIYKGGEDITARFQDRAVSITVELASGQGQQDTVDIILDDRDWLISTPHVKDRLSVYLGYKNIGLAYMGAFEVNSVRFAFPPKLITVRGTAASSLNDLKSHVIKEHSGTVESILAEAGSKIGMKVRIHPSIADEKINFVNQTSSLAHLIGKLELQYGAVAKITDGLLTMVPRGTGKSVSDFSIPTFVLKPEHFADCEVLTESKGETARTVASFTDRTSNQRVDVESKSELKNLDTEAVHRITTPFASKEEAEAAAKSVQGQLDRSTGKVFATLAEGDPWVRDAQRIIITNCRDGVNGSYLIEVIRHSFTKNGALRSSFSGVAGTEGLAEQYADSGPTSPDFIAPKPGQVFGQLLPQLPTTLGSAFTSIPSLVGQPVPNP